MQEVALVPKELGPVHGRQSHVNLPNTQKLHPACTVIELKTAGCGGVLGKGCVLAP